jgi:outer membrane lipoprotein-sorting protein
MTEHNERPTRDVLKEALEALQAEPVPEGPPAHLVASTIEALQKTMVSPEALRLQQRRKLMIRIARYSTLATAAALLLALGVSFFYPSPLAFGQVVENIKKAKSVSFATKMPTVIRGTQRGVVQQRFYIQGEHYRMEIPSAQEGVDIPADAPPVWLAIVADHKQKKSLQLDFVRKTYQFLEPNDKAWQEWARANPIEELRRLKNEDAEPIGEEEIDGHKTKVYRLKKRDIVMGLHLGEDDTAKLWVDPKSGLPVRIRVDGQTPASRGPSDKTFMIFEQFTWDEAFDPNLFKLEVPEGFTVENK